MSALPIAPNTARARLAATRLNLTLWTLQGWLAMFFIAAGYAKLTESRENLIELLHWPAHAAPALVRGLGIAEIVLAALVLAPLVSWRIGRPFLVAAAAALLGLETVMLALHLLGRDLGLAGVNLILMAMTAPVLWLRARERR